jgi:quercetin 2,3-dioxygenase
MLQRSVVSMITGQPASDGAGVKLNRVISFQPGLDPFLMLDEFNSDKADDYIAGFPSHPHRGFETVTYMLEGRMLHQDHLGNQGLLVSGAVQWMCAGRGIIHSEMPQQEQGRMRGFQLWLNLPAAEKMQPAGYRDIPPSQIPCVAVAGGEVKVIAGDFHYQGEVTHGAVQGVSTQPLYFDIALEANRSLEVAIPRGHTALLYVFDHSLQVGDIPIHKGRLAQLDDGDGVTLLAGAEGGRALLLAARPLREPMVHYGPFVMNTQEEIDQAIADYRHGRLAA